MKIGDKVKVRFDDGNYAFGMIMGETVDGWKIDFLDGERPRLIKKSKPIELVKNPAKPKPEPKPVLVKKETNWKVIGIVAAVVLIAVVAVILLA